MTDPTGSSPHRRHQRGTSDLMAYVVGYFNTEALSALPDAPVVDDGYRAGRSGTVRRSLASTLRAAAATAARWAHRLDPARGAEAPSLEGGANRLPGELCR